MELTKIIALAYLGAFVIIFVLGPWLLRILRRRWQLGGAQLLTISQPESATPQRKYACDHTVLPEIVTACSCCKKVRDTDGVWYPWEEYLHRHDVHVSHGVCQDCGDTLYPWRKDREKAV